jgi:hypothetical protein
VLNLFLPVNFWLNVDITTAIMSLVGTSSGQDLDLNKSLIAQLK